MGGELSIRFINADSELRVVAVLREQALKGEGFAKTGGAFHTLRRRLDRPGEPADRRSALPLARSPRAKRIEVVPAQARLAN